MRFKPSSVVAALVIMAAPVTTANAQYLFGNSSDICGGNNFTFCFAISSVQTGANFFITITNEGLNGSGLAPYNTLSFASIGFNGTAPSSISAESAGASYTLGSISDLSDFPGTWFGANADSPAPKDGLLFGEQITFEFANVTGSAASFTDDLAFHAISGPGNCSSKLEVNLGAAAPANGTPFITTACGGLVTSTPEPASLALMATGLLGLGAGVIRRRRES